MEEPVGQYCRYDFLTVTGGRTGREVVFPRQCGVSTEPTVIGNPYPKTEVLFRTDEAVTNRGFNLSYGLQPCGGLLEGPSASLLSPDHPAPYPASSRCTWLLHFSPGSQIEFRFLSPLSLASPCSGDLLTIRNGPYPTSPALWAGCSDPPATLLTMSNKVLVEFMSDGVGSGAGFNISATEHTAGCGGVLHGLVCAHWA
jgi:hypothetical protein